MNALAFDRRAELGGRPGTHALIVGVSGYPFLPTTAPPDPHAGEGPPGPPDYGLRQLSSTSLAAFKVYEWMVEHKDDLEVPLATCRLLLTPAWIELETKPAMGEAPRATKANLSMAAGAWREDASKNPRNMTWFYVAGHGIERSPDDRVLLLDEFGQSGVPMLHHAVVTRRIVEGMAPAGPYQNVGRSQLFFVDACRTTPEAFGAYKLPEVGDIWDIYRPEGAGLKDDRRKATFYATIPGRPAYARKGEQTVFSEALLSCLKGNAGVQAGDLDAATGQANWCVTSHSLHAGLEYQLRGSEQRYTLDDLGIGETITLNRLEGPPDADVIMWLRPEGVEEVVCVNIHDSWKNAIRSIGPPLMRPHRESLKAGIYRVDAHAEGEKRLVNSRNLYQVIPTQPSSSIWRIDMKEEQ